MDHHSLTPKGDYLLITKLLKTVPLLVALLSTPAFAAEPTPPQAIVSTAAPTSTELQQKVDILQLLAQTLKEQRDAILDQLTVSQVTIKQLQAAAAASTTKK